MFNWNKIRDGKAWDISTVSDVCPFIVSKTFLVVLF